MLLSDDEYPEVIAFAVDPTTVACGAEASIRGVCVDEYVGVSSVCVVELANCEALFEDGKSGDWE